MQEAAPRFPSRHVPPFPLGPGPVGVNHLVGQLVHRVTEVGQAHGQTGDRIGRDQAAVLDPVDVDERLAVELRGAPASHRSPVGVGTRSRIGLRPRRDHSVLVPLAVVREGRQRPVVLVQGVVVRQPDADEVGMTLSAPFGHFADQPGARRHQTRGVVRVHTGDQVFGLGNLAVLDVRHLLDDGQSHAATSDRWSGVARRAAVRGTRHGRDQRRSPAVAGQAARAAGLAPHRGQPDEPEGTVLARNGCVESSE